MADGFFFLKLVLIAIRSVRNVDLRYERLQFIQVTEAMIGFTPARNHIGEGFGSDKKLKRRFRSGFCNGSE